MTEELVDVWDNYYATMEDTAIKDRSFFELEVEAITSRVLAAAEASQSPNLRLLELGSGTGFLAERILERLQPLEAEIHFDGVDFSATGTEKARERALANCEFHESDFLAFVEGAEEPYDILITQRSIMAILEPDPQTRLLEGVRDLIKPGGVGLLSEGSVQGLARLNELRAELGVEALEKVWHSRYLDEDEIDRIFPGVEVVHFAPLYWLLTRVVYPYFEEPRHNTPLHQFAATLPQTGDASPVRLFAVRT
jgi:SAM-dependent methyltransferase